MRGVASPARSLRRWGSTLVVAAALALGCGARAQDPTVKADGQAFGAAIQPQALAASKVAPTAATVPNFTANPAQTTYMTNPNALGPAAASLAPGSVGYQTVSHSMAVRAKFPKTDIDATIARGKAVSAAPLTYVQGYSASGTSGSCHPLPPTSSSPGTYEQACNAGYVAGSGPQSCPVTVQHVITQKVVDIYWCTYGDYQSNGVDDCELPGLSQCKLIASKPGKCLQGKWPYCTEPGDPIEVRACSGPIAGAKLRGTQTQNVDVRTVNDSACASIAATTGCANPNDVCVDSTPNTRTISGVPITEACWGWTRTYACSTLTPAEDCSALPPGCVFEREECLTGQSPCLTVDKVYRCPLPAVPGQKQQICDGDVYCLNGQCDTIDRKPSTDFKDAAVALNVMSQAGKNFDPESLTLFKGTRMTCSKTIFGLSDCCVPRGFPLLGSCNAEDQMLKKQRDKGLCTRIGSYCSSSFLGICLAKKEAHCCFLSKISRILQEQGRPQINKPWAKPQDEKCLGFTLDEFSHLDLSKMDFSEVYAEFTSAAKLPDELATANDLKQKIADYYKQHH